MGSLKLEDIHYTYDDYKLWEGNWELINGIAVAMSPAPVRKHQGLAVEILYNLREQFLIPMAITLAFGLMSGTTGILFVFPSIMAIINDIKCLFKK